MLAAVVATVPAVFMGIHAPLAIAGAAGFGWLAWKPERGVIAIFVLMVLAPVTINAGWPGSTLTWVYAAVVALAVVGRTQRLLHLDAIEAQEVWIFLPFAAICAASLVNWPGSGAFLSYARPYLVFTLVAWHVLAEARRAPDAIGRAIRVLLWVSVPLALLAVYQRATGTWPVLDEFATSAGYQSFAGQERAAAVMGQPVIYGSFCMAMLVPLMTMPVQRKYLFVAANVLGLFLSGTRSALLAVLVVALVCFLRGRRITGVAAWYAVTAGMAVVVAAMLYPSVVLDPVAGYLERLENMASSESGLARQLRFDIAWDHIAATDAAFLVGQGPGAFVDYFTTTSVGDGLAQTIDNSYLTLWFDFGLVPVVAMMGLLLAGILRGAWPGRMLLLGFAVEIYFFDFYSWPSVMAVAILGAALRVYCQASELLANPNGTTTTRREVPVRLNTVTRVPVRKTFSFPAVPGSVAPRANGAPTAIGYTALPVE